MPQKVGKYFYSIAVDFEKLKTSVNPARLINTTNNGGGWLLR